MITKKNVKLSPVNKVLPIGETIKDILFIKLPELGGDKMFWIFESGRVLVMPVYRECPVQVGTMDDFKLDVDEFINKLNTEATAVITERDSTIEQLKELKKWHGQQQIR
ncbi:hypothetical protein KAR91_43060 [Candidatus Pacearchaeota archaeon]|nr:hypothetical protein [Candidatus Pacearchaeota archaeon]